jgi:hypothetical protein
LLNSLLSAKELASRAAVAVPATLNSTLLGPLPFNISQALEADMEEHYRAGDMQAVVHLYSGLIASGFTPTTHLTAVCCAAYLDTRQTHLAVPLMDSLLQEGYKPRIQHVVCWATAYHDKQRTDSALDLLQDTTARSPTFALQRLGWLCAAYFWNRNVNRLAATLRESRLIDVAHLQRATDHCSTADGYFHALALATCGHTERALSVLVAGGYKLDSMSNALLIFSSCLAAEEGLKQNLASVLDAKREVPLKARHARLIAETCAAYDRSALQRVLTALIGLKLDGELELTQQMCSLAIAAACELNDADAAVMWLDVMQQQGLHCEQLLYYLVAKSCGTSKQVHEASRVLTAAKAAGVMSQLTEEHSSHVLEALLKLQRSIEPLLAVITEEMQLAIQILFTESHYRSADMTDQRWCQRNEWDYHGGPARAAAAAVRFFLSDAAQQQGAGCIAVADLLHTAAVPCASGLTVDNSNEACIKFTTGSAIGCAVAKELYPELRSGAVSSISNDADGTTTYTITVPGLQSYFANWKEILDSDSVIT